MFDSKANGLNEQQAFTIDAAEREGWDILAAHRCTGSQDFLVTAIHGEYGSGMWRINIDGQVRQEEL